MVSYIFVGTNRQKALEEINKITEQLQISRLDQVNLELELSDKPATSIGIAEIKKLLQKIYLKPLQSPNKAIIIKDAQALTPEAQNALLKVIEEPPVNTYIYFLSNNLYSILPTLQSRCSIIYLENELSNFNNTSIQVPKSIGDKLVVAEKYSRQKSTAITFLQELLMSYHQKLHEENNPFQLIEKIRKIDKCLKLLQTTNVNTRLTLEHVLLYEEAGE